jgi:putative restriction endonuclease
LPDVASEIDRRLGLWKTLTSDNIDNIEPKRLRDLRIYGGAQGIWVDKAQTASNEVGLDGNTVGVLHTGRHYADDLSDDGVIYHYPKTSRPPALDAAEVQATKNAMLHQLPIFIILPGKSSRSLRSVKIGWVCDFDDNNRQFLILFSQETLPTYSKAKDENDPFRLIEEPRKLQHHTFAENLNEDVMTGGTEFHYVQPTIMLSIITCLESLRVHVRFYVSLGSPRPI